MSSKLNFHVLDSAPLPFSIHVNGACNGLDNMLTRIYIFRVDAVTSLRARIDDLRTKEQDRIQKATKLYVVGGWSTALPIGTCTEAVSTICKLIKEMAYLKKLT